MKTRSLLALVAALAGLSALRAVPASANNDSRIDVAFDHPEKFTDLKDSEFPSDSSRQAYMDELKEHLQKNATRHLADGQKLSVTITDVDMAGDFEPWRGPNFYDIRIVKDVYPPRIDLNFKLTDASGAVVKEGKRELRDLDFQMHISPIDREDPLRYEKALLDDWTRSEFRGQKKSK